MRNYLYVLEGEYFKRPWWRWTVFLVLGCGLVFLALFGSYRAKGGQGDGIKFADILNALILLILYGGYCFWTIKRERSPAILKVTEQGLLINTILKDRATFQGFLLEVDESHGVLKNIVLVYHKDHTIHTIIEENPEDIEECISILQGYIPHLENYNQSFIEKVMRKLRL